MATLVFGAIGTVFGGPIGGFLGATIGGAIDNFVLFPALFPSPRPEGPRIDGVNISSGNEGTAMNWFLGPKIRVGGAVIWMSDLEEKKVESGKGGGKGMTNYEYYASIAISFGEVGPQPFNKIDVIFGDVKPIYDGKATNIYDDITIYDGTQQTPDPLMEAYLGVGRVPCFKKQVYVVIKRLYLGEFGNRVPNFQAIVSQQPDCSLAKAIGFIMQRAGFEESDYDATRVSYCLRGINFSGVVDTSSCLSSVSGTFNVGMQEVDGKFVFFDQGKEVAIEISSSELVSDNNSGFSFTDKYDTNLPDSVNVTYISWENEDQPGSVIYRDHTKRERSEENQINFDTPVVLTPDEASAVARRQYWQAVGESRAVEFSLPPKYGNLAGGDLIHFNHKGNSLYIRAQSVEYGANGQVNVNGFVTWPGIFTQVGDPFNSGYEGFSIKQVENLRGFVLDCPALSDDHTSAMTLYYGTYADGQAYIPLQSTLYTTFEVAVGNANRNYSTAAGVTGLSYVGKTFSVDYKEIRNDIWWDGDTEIVVKVYDPTFIPTSATDYEVMNFRRNIIAVSSGDYSDWEIIGFVNASPVAGESNTYKLTRLARGMRGTSHLIEQTSGSANVVFLTSSQRRTIADFNLDSEYAQDIMWKSVPIYEVIDNIYPGFTHVKGRSLKPFPISHLRYEKELLDVPGETWYDITLKWQRRTKKFTDPFAPRIPIAADESGVLGTLEIWKMDGTSSGTVKLRTIGIDMDNADGSYTLTHSIRQAISDEVLETRGINWAVTDRFLARIYVNSRIVGSSEYQEIIVPPNLYE